MVSITLSVPEEIRSLMKRFPEINWSGLVRKAIENKAKELAWKEEMLNKIETEKEFTDFTVELGKKSKKGRFNRIIKKNKMS